MRKSPAQLNREIAEVLARKRGTPLDRTIDVHPGVRSLIVKNIATAGTLPKVGDRVTSPFEGGRSSSEGTVIGLDDPREVRYPGVWVAWDGITEAQWWTGKLIILGRATPAQRKVALL